MEKAMEKVMETLVELNCVYAKILELSGEKKEAIVKNDAQLVNEIVLKEWDKVKEADELEQQRVEDSRELSVLWGIPEEEVTLSVLVEKTPDEQKQKVISIGTELVDTLYKQQVLNKEIQQLLELHFEYADFMVNTFLRDPQLSSIYGNSGNVEDTEISKAGLIDNQA